MCVVCVWCVCVCERVCNIPIIANDNTAFSRGYLRNLSITFISPSPWQQSCDNSLVNLYNTPSFIYIYLNNSKHNIKFYSEVQF